MELPIKSGQNIIVTYTLQYVTDCNQLLTMDFTPGDSDCIPLPDNRTNVRSSPVFRTATYPADDFAEYGSYFACLDIPTYQVSWGTGTTGLTWNDIYPLINLYFYKLDSLYYDMQSTTDSLTSLPPLKPTGTNGIPFEYIYKKQVSSIDCSVDGNTWTTSLKFLFDPGEWPTTATSFSLLMGAGTPSKAIPDQRPNAGIVTALMLPYDPYVYSSEIIIGIEYVFKWTRA
jgi:hypothetical protein